MVRRLRIVIIVLIALAAMMAVFEFTRPYRPDNIIDGHIDVFLARSPAHGRDAEDDYMPVYFEIPENAPITDFMVVSNERRNYIDDSMILVIPSLDLRLPIRGGTTKEELAIGPGLFEASGIPGQVGANVGIAGHRSRDQFYYLDRLKTGDQLYLEYDTNVYTYIFHELRIVEPSDWGVIARQGFDACTLVTCTPIGVANKRLVAIFALL